MSTHYGVVDVRSDKDQFQCVHIMDEVEKMWEEEALFGHRHVSPYLRDLPDASEVLEVGAGSGLLIHKLSTQFTRLRFTGVEPKGPGFADMPHLFDDQDNVDFQTVGYQNLDRKNKYDLIYLVNVFEHLSDWPDFLKFVNDTLSSNGRCIILCPNYSFPYESHFGVPIIVSKAITYKIFGEKIRRFETDNNCDGLWKGLNFVSLRQVRKSAKALQLKIDTHPDILKDLIERLDTDREFSARQGVLGKFAKAAHLLGIIKLLEWSPFHHWHPYMKIELKR